MFAKRAIPFRGRALPFRGKKISRPSFSISLPHPHREGTGKKEEGDAKYRGKVITVL